MRFADKATEKAFLENHYNPREIRAVLAIATFIFSSYIVLDRILFPEYVMAFLSIRVFFFIPLGAILLLITYTPLHNRICPLLLILITIFSAAGITLMEYIARDSAYSGLYFFGIAQVLTFFYGVGKVPHIPSIIVGAVVVSGTVIFNTFFVDSDNLVSFTKGLFLATMWVIGVIISYIIQYHSRVNYINRIRIENMSITDNLTGLRNRHFFESVVETELLYYINRKPDSRQLRMDRAEDFPGERYYGVIVLDIDHFKTVNDSYGHAAGDQVLKEFARRISRIIRVTDMFMRWGGEEFLLVLRNTRPDHIGNLAEILQREISETPFEIGREAPIIVTVSGGILLLTSGSCRGIATSADILVELADEALYRAKEEGRNRFIQIIPSGLAKSAAREFVTIRS